MRRILANGEPRNLARMLSPKLGFPLAYWKRKNILFGVGGYNDLEME